MFGGRAALPGARMKFCTPFLFALVWLTALSAPAQQPVTTDAAPYNALILQEIRTMPQAGGYSASHAATARLGSAVAMGDASGLDVQAARAQPSYCSGATYLVFLKAVDALARAGAAARR